ncbi:MAG: hypothetical protein EOO62_26860 [Hymenobacter sp.]|nr:MAG: hypothetical protein EOO62_26860 [Hymenobacter sp.]
MMNNYLLTLAAGSLLLLGSCSKEEVLPQGCPIQEVPTTAITGWDASPYCFATPVADMSLTQSYVVNSASELQAFNHCSSVPNIDFARYTLLIGKTKTAACSSVKTQLVTRSCIQYTYKVELAAGLCQASTEVLYYALVPKVADGEKVVFEVVPPS